MKREWVFAGFLWAALTALLEFVTWNASLLPTGYAHEASISDDAFRTLLRLAIPVFALVVAVLDVAVARFRHRGDEPPPEDGPPIRGNRKVQSAWLGVTSALAVMLIFYPGLTGLAAIQGRPTADRVVKIEGARWFWTVSYPDAKVTTSSELVLPAKQRIRFEISSKDVIHSVWVPAFRMRLDAVPNRTTVMYVTTEKTGSFATEENLRLQCSMLCGLGHATMRIPVRVVTAEAFDAWLQSQSGASKADSTCKPAGASLEIAAKSLAFDKKCLAAPAGQPFTIAFDNQEAMPHNVAIYGDKTAAKVLFKGAIVNGPAKTTYQVPALEKGTYFYRCDIHPIPAMSGTFNVG